MKKIYLTILLVFNTTGLEVIAQQRATYENMVVTFGNFHAHSILSADVRGNYNTLSPETAFKYAHQNGLDFLAITDHHKGTDNRGNYFLTASQFKNELYDVAMKYNADNSGDFIAVPGIEWGNTATGNHVNVLGLQELPPDTILNTDYHELYDFAKNQNAIIQFNHPKSWSGKTNRNKNIGNFGRALFNNESDFITRSDDVVKMISIICSVQRGHISGPFKHSQKKTHREMQWENQYKEHLNMGFHISPSANQDTHWKNWGTVTAARTAVWTEKLTYTSFMDALKQNRIYATEDDEMAVVFQVEYKDNKYWMGESVTLTEELEEVIVHVQVWQATGSDNDDVNEGPYTIKIISDSDGTGGREASVWKTFKNVPGNQLKTIALNVRKGSYFYIEVTEENGKDNLLGQGEDEINNETGFEAADGKRDDANDSAWTTPIWFH